MAETERKFGAALRRLRRRRGLRMIDVAFKAGLSSDAEVSRLECGHVPNASWRKLDAVIRAMGASWEDFEREMVREVQDEDHNIYLTTLAVA